jgi:hypothetical protein
VHHCLKGCRLRAIERYNWTEVFDMAEHVDPTAQLAAA